MQKNNERVAVLVDGGFFLKRLSKLFMPCEDYDRTDAHQTALLFKKLTRDHIQAYLGETLYRVFYYDCKPLDKRVMNPISGHVIDFAKSPVAIFRTELFEELKKQRKVALRLGIVKDNDAWFIQNRKTKELLAHKLTLDELTENDIQFDIKQKGIDMKIGLDISALAYKKLVDRIVLIAGDSDFVPAAKVARREGIDFILDPMWNQIGDDLFEHIDGIHSTCPRQSEMPKTIELFFNSFSKDDESRGNSIPEFKAIN
jgi:uncharacterized LabA/DUF88 family protein